MKWPFRKKQDQEAVREGYNLSLDGYNGHYLPTLRPFTYQAQPNAFTRANDQYAGGYPPYPKAQSDHARWYNNAYWGNRLPNSETGIYGVSQRLWYKQYSPEQTIRTKQNLTGGAYPYGMSIQQGANIIAQQSAAWKASSGNA